ncbi:hypothetical protein B0H13DRAFT_1919326 [Mycena leptocephala]|nr:hypothetical protein B0H13DRAFT_1919326 [Mycena leptocephala]
MPNRNLLVMVTADVEVAQALGAGHFLKINRGLETAQEFHDVGNEDGKRNLEYSLNSVVPSNHRRTSKIQKTVLARPPAPSREDTAYGPEKSDPLPSDPTVTPQSPSSTPEYTEILDYATGTTKRVPMQRFQHTSTAPRARKISHDEDPHDMPFVPFADDPTFDHARYLKAYQDFSWRTSALDPDLEVVVVETARRLRTEHQMLYQHIDETGVLPLELLADFPKPPSCQPAKRRLATASTARRHSGLSSSTRDTVQPYLTHMRPICPLPPASP